MTRAKFGDVHVPLVIRLFKWTESLDFRSKLRSGSGDDWAATRAMAWVALVAGPPLGSRPGPEGGPEGRPPRAPESMGPHQVSM